MIFEIYRAGERTIFKEVKQYMAADCIELLADCGFFCDTGEKEGPWLCCFGGYDNAIWWDVAN